MTFSFCSSYFQGPRSAHYKKRKNKVTVFHIIANIDYLIKLPIQTSCVAKVHRPRTCFCQWRFLYQIWRKQMGTSRYREFGVSFLPGHFPGLGTISVGKNGAELHRRENSLAGGRWGR